MLEGVRLGAARPRGRHGPPSRGGAGGGRPGVESNIPRNREAVAQSRRPIGQPPTAPRPHPHLLL